MNVITSLETYNKGLLQRVLAGQAHVITYKDYNNLPISLKSRYYPLFKRFDTTYRLKVNYMKPRIDIDPNTVSPTVVQNKRVIVGKQPYKNPTTQVSPISKVSVEVTDTNTEISHKTFGDLIQEARMLKKLPISVTTKFSNY